MTDAEVIAYLVGTGQGNRVAIALAHSDDTSGHESDPISKAVAVSRARLGDTEFAWWVARGRADATKPANPPRGWRVFCPNCDGTISEPGLDNRSWCGNCLAMVVAHVKIARV